MKNRFLIPALAMFFAIGMSFATGTTANDPIWDYVDSDNGVIRVSEVQDCGSQQKQCEAELEENGQTYAIFDDMGLTTPKLGGGVIEFH